MSAPRRTTIKVEARPGQYDTGVITRRILRQAAAAAHAGLLVWIGPRGQYHYYRDADRKVFVVANIDRGYVFTETGVVRPVYADPAVGHKMEEWADRLAH